MGCILANIDTTVLGLGAVVECGDNHASAVIAAQSENRVDMSSYAKSPSLYNRVVCTPRGYAVGTFSFSMSCELHEIIKPEFTYTRLTHIESTGSQHIKIDYTLTESDTIDALYEPTTIVSKDQFVFGAPNTWYSTYNNTGYTRFGYTGDSTSITNGTWRFRIQLSKGKIVINEQTTTTIPYTGLSGSGVAVFSGLNASGSAYNRGSFRMMWFRIKNSSGICQIDLAPVKRDNDGKIGMLDLVSGTFYASMDEGADFIGGNEINITDDYELIDRVLFNRDIGFDTCYQGNERTYIDVLFQRTDTSGSDYLLGCSPSGKARITAYLSSSGTWRYGTTLSKNFNTANKNVLRASVSPTGIKINELSQTYTATEFTTVQDIPLGGHRSTESSNAITKTYRGFVYYFRMRHGNELLLDWYPCRRKSDGVEGFWDCVTQQFITPM